MKAYIRPEINIRSFDRVLTEDKSNHLLGAYAEWMESKNANSMGNVTIKRVEAYSFN